VSQVRREGWPGPPKRSGVPVPVAGRAALRRAPSADAGEAVRAVLRRAPVAVPREAVRAVLRRAPVAVPRWAGCQRRRGGGFGPQERGRRYLRRGPVSQVLWGRARGAPKSAVCRAPRARTRPRRARAGVPERGFNAMMLRSAEADPHVIEHKAGPGAEAPVSPREIAPQVPVPKRRRRDDNRTPAGAGIAPDGRGRARPAARGPPPGFHGRSRGAPSALRPHPPRWADVRFVETSRSSRLQGFAPLTSPS